MDVHNANDLMNILLDEILNEITKGAAFANKTNERCVVFLDTVALITARVWTGKIGHLAYEFTSSCSPDQMFGRSLYRS